MRIKLERCHPKDFGKAAIGERSTDCSHVGLTFVCHQPPPYFKGECPDLEGGYFDFSTGYREDMYKTSIRLMIIYIARKYDIGDDIKMILNELKMSTSEKPEALD